MSDTPGDLRVQSSPDPRFRSSPPLAVAERTPVAFRYYATRLVAARDEVVITE